MGILTLLRNAFGRSRKGRTAEAEGATPSPEPQPTVPSPSPEPQPTATAQVPEPRVAEPTAPEGPETPETPKRAEATAEPAEGTSKDEHELVSAAFNNVTVPKPAKPVETVAEGEAAPEGAAAAEEAAAETAVAEEAAAEATVAEEAVAETPVAEEAAAETAVAEEAVTETPVAEEAAAETPVAEEPTAEEAVAETPVAEEPVVEEPAAEEPAAAEPVAETPVAAEPEPVVDEPAPVAAAEEAAPEPEPVAEVTPEPAAAETHDEPAAADGEDAPQGPLAADDESSTGGAGGNPEAEGEAEATPATDTPAAADGEAAPQGPLTADDESSTGGAGGNPEPEGEAEEEAEPEAVDTAPKIPRTLRTAHRAAATALKKHDLTGTNAKVYLVLDRSASMRPYYKDGSAQALGDQTLALAAHLDPEATVHVVFFSTELDGTGELTLTDHETKIDELHAALGRMGRTSYHVAVDEVVTHHQKTAPDTPALVIFQTDGAPDAKTPATHALTEAAKNHPSVFFSFVAFGDPEQKAFDYLRKLKTDNTAHFLAGETPLELTDQQVYEGILANWRP
ncbi:VWA domain-containing protein [Streptomyces shaanxiensis]|uniref:VWFA domain-containing protein n=1 Tax=Streptomyces shaanxiensis TaxID=653357 RepID=A0ABP7VDX0_9ACTN